MKAIKNNTDSSVWLQLSEKIKDSDESRERDSKELHDKVYLILGKKDLQVTIPKNSKIVTSFTEKV